MLIHTTMHSWYYCITLLSTATGRGLALQCSSLSVSDFSVCLPGCHSGAFTAWIAFTQQLKVTDFDVKASLSNKSELSRWLAELRRLTSYTRPSFESLITIITMWSRPICFRFHGKILWAFAGSTVLWAYTVFLVSLQASSGILLTVETPSACQAQYLYNILAVFADSAVILVLAFKSDFLWL